MVKVSKTWTGKKNSLPSPDKKEQHQNRKTKQELVHRWDEQDWDLQLKDYLHATQQIQE